MKNLQKITIQTPDELRREMLQMRELLLPDDENIGKKFQFKDDDDNQVFVIVCCQKLWGFDENNEYKMLNGYRSVPENEPNSFGFPTEPRLIKFIN
jgi:hypothetical protein